ncbi:helix-turn-helix transcriptional regulator [Candidatus Microgenomates bacterium]|nr:helix-turn-helix transcriptional regulator [Candidatus Microgenomates bacterium]
MAGFSKKERERIYRRARYIQAAMALRKLRKALKLSQEKLAKRMKVKREFISRIESGEQNVTLETLYKIAEATGKEFSFRFR